MSRGTREQLYLALFFGLIRQSAEALAELARSNQVLVFTCHPTIAKLFTTVDPQDGH